MINEDRYIIKYKDNSIGYFFYNKDKEIVYKTLKNNMWSEENIACKNALDNFCVVTEKEDEVKVIFQDTFGNIKICMYNGSGWIEQTVMNRKNNNKSSLHFKVIVHNNNINFFYIMSDKNYKEKVLVHQVFYEYMDLSKPKIIDKISFESKNLFSIKDSKESIYIFYENSNNNKYQLGYRKFSLSGSILSEFYVLNESYFNYIDQSVLISKKKFHILYIKKEENACNLIYTYKELERKKSIIISQEKKIKSCSLFMVKGQLLLFWVSDNNIYYCFSYDNGENFTVPEIYEKVNLYNPMKVSYEYKESDKNTYINEIYVYGENSNSLTTIPSIFDDISNGKQDIREHYEEEKNNIEVDNIIEINENEYQIKKNTTDTDIEYNRIDKRKADNLEGKLEFQLDIMKKHVDEINKNLKVYKKKIIQQENQIAQLEYTLGSRNDEILQLQYSIKEKVMQYKNLVIEKDNFFKIKTDFQEQLETKDKDINKLKDNIINIQNELIYQKNKILDKEIEIDSLKDDIESLKNDIEFAKNKKGSFFKQFFNNDENS